MLEENVHQIFIDISVANQALKDSGVIVESDTIADETANPVLVVMVTALVEAVDSPVISNIEELRDKDFVVVAVTKDLFVVNISANLMNSIMVKVSVRGSNHSEKVRD